MNSLLPHHRHRGFTLIELVLYISIMSILLLGLAVLMSTILETRERHQVIAEVEQQGIQIMQKLTQSLKDADSVELPVLGSSGSTLSLTPHENAANTTVFTIQDGILTSTVSILPSISLHNDAIFLTDLVFLNV